MEQDEVKERPLDTAEEGRDTIISREVQDNQKRQGAELSVLHKTSYRDKYFELATVAAQLFTVSYLYS